MHAFVARTGNLVSPPHWIPTPLNIRVERADPAAGADLCGVIAERQEERRGSWRSAVDATACPGRGERPAHDRRRSSATKS